MMKKHAYRLALLSCLAVAPLHAQVPDDQLVTPTTPESVVEAATPASADNSTAGITFSDWVSEFERQFQPIGIAEGGRSFFVGQAAVIGSPLDAHFGRQLALAYEQAMFDMRADFVMQNYGRLKVESVRSQFQDDSSNRDDFPEAELDVIQAGGSRLAQWLDKALQSLTEKNLDDQLIEDGVPAEEVQRMSVDQKKTLYKNNLHKNTVKRAVHSMQGLVPVQTRIFTEDSPNGKVVIVGVIAVRSDKTQQFARDISRKRPSLVTGNPRSLSDLLPADSKGYLDEIGLRFTYDEQGRPMLLSYGRTSVSIAPDWSPSRAFQARQNATQQAQSLAESSIVEFMNTNIQVEQTDSIGAVEEEQLERITYFDAGKKSDVEDTRRQISEAISTFTRSGRATAQGDLRGTTVVKRWEEKDENGVLHVGSVVAWTYGQLDNANAIDAQGRNQATTSKQNTPGTAVDQSRSSRMVNDKSDF